MSRDPEVDLVDRIAQDLPLEVRAAYYRELNHCRSLPENDEMLRILRAMQFLTLLMRQVPDQVTAERARIAALFGQAVQELRDFAQRAAEYRSAIEDRLVELPTAVVEGLRPERVAREINESLRQQFAASTIPQTARSSPRMAHRKVATGCTDGLGLWLACGGASVFHARCMLHSMARDGDTILPRVTGLRSAPCVPLVGPGEGRQAPGVCGRRFRSRTYGRRDPRGAPEGQP